MPKANPPKPPGQKPARPAQRPKAQVSSEVRQRVDRAPVAQSKVGQNRRPKMSYSPDGRSCTISHCERIGTVLGSVAFTTSSFSVNPGLPASFPWLAGIANRFEAYRFDDLRFEYRTKCATTATGDVILAVDYDASDAAPTASVQAENYDESSSSAPWQGMFHVSRKENLHKLPQRYVRGEAVPTGSDVKLSDVGTLFVCTENQADASLVGYLYVHYTVRLFTPQLRPSDFAISGGLLSGSGTMTAANPCGTTASMSANSRGLSVSAASRLTFTSLGDYMLDAQLVGTVASAITMTAVSGCTITAVYASFANAGATEVRKTMKVVVTAPNATMDFTVTATTVTAFLVVVSSIPSNALAFVEEKPLTKEQVLTWLSANGTATTVTKP